MSKMSLINASKGRLSRPIKILLHGTEGVGKSTFASCAPKPIFLCAENGTAHLDITRFPAVERWEDALEALEVLTSEKHDHQTLVVDTLDWLEPFVWDHVTAHYPPDKMGRRPKSINDIGYAKGFDVALDQWRIFLDRIERLQAAKSMHVVLLAHSEIKTFRNPEGEDYERYQIRLHHKAAGKIIQWVDAVLFASFDQATTKDGGKVIGVGTGARIMRTEKRPAFDAKNRYGLPFRMPLSWEDLEEAATASHPVSAAQLEEARALAVQIGVVEKVEAAIARAGDDGVKVATLIDWLRAKVPTNETSEETSNGTTQAA